MNIYSNVEKENTSKKFMLIIVSLLLIGSVYAVFQANLTASVSDTAVRMTEAEKIKQIIREKEHLKDQFAEAGREAAESNEFDKSRDMADKVGILADEIKKLYDDLHEANVREGVNGEEKK